jgi:uncharacterized protein (UPF0262 family)
MSDHRIVGITLDDKTVVRRSPEVEHELNVAIYDIIERNQFKPAGSFRGPYRIHLSIEDRRRLVFAVADDDGGTQGRVVLALLLFRRIVRDYFKICESYYDAIAAVAVADRDHRHGATVHPRRRIVDPGRTAAWQDRGRRRDGAPSLHADLRPAYPGVRARTACRTAPPRPVLLPAPRIRCACRWRKR